MRSAARALFFLALLAALISPLTTWYFPVQAQSAASSVVPIGKPVQIKTPLGLPPVPIPADTPPTEETISLCRRLYYDPQLSVDGSISCASCHAPQFAFSDDRPFSEGVGKKLGSRHAPTVVNSAYNALQFWDGRAPSLEEQAKGPIANRSKWPIRLRAWLATFRATPGIANSSSGPGVPT